MFLFLGLTALFMHALHTNLIDASLVRILVLFDFCQSYLVQNVRFYSGP